LNIEQNVKIVLVDSELVSLQNTNRSRVLIEKLQISQVGMNFRKKVFEQD
jgi:hypothetical protein